MNRETKFNDFCLEMYYRNCEEREAFKDASISFQDYFRVNQQFLLDKFEEICNTVYS